MLLHGLQFPEAALADFCCRHGVRQQSLFGSILTDHFTPDSDVDMLVEFEAGRTPGMIGFGQMILELTAMVGRRVDLRTPHDLSRYILPQVRSRARTLHAA